MARATEADWIKARALFETGKSLNEISRATGIDRATISKKSKTELWAKGKFQQLILDGARVVEEISTLDSTVQQLVVEGIDELAKAREFYFKAGQRVAQLAVKSLGTAPNPAECKTVSETLVNTMKVSGIVPYYNAPATINNTNAIQSNHDSVRSEIISRVLSKND